MTGSPNNHPLFNSLEQRKKILHFLLLTSGVVIVLSCIPDFIYGIWESLYFVTFGISIVSLSLYLNATGRTDLAAHIVIFCGSLMLFVQGSLMGPEALIAIYYLPLILGVAFIFDHRKKLHLAFHITHPILFLILLQFTDTSYLLSDQYNHEGSLLMGKFNIIAAVVLCFFFVIVIIYYNQRSHAELLTLNKTLEIQNNELSKVNKELDQLVYSISHDLRSPVASALGLTELIVHEPEEKNIRHYNDLTRTCLRRLDQYIIDLLDYLKNNRMELLPQEVIPEGEIKMVVLLNQPYHSDVNVELHCDPDLTLVTDRSRFRIILNNLISNAFRYMRPEERNKKILITVRKENQGVTIVIHDNGLGIIHKNRDSIFDMFFRVDENTKGSGLGLYITKEAVTKLNGLISLNSEYGKFTEFTVYLPDLSAGERKSE